MQQLTLAQANQMIASAFARAQEAGHRPMGFVVLDSIIDDDLEPAVIEQILHSNAERFLGPVRGPLS